MTFKIKKFIGCLGSFQVSEKVNSKEFNIKYNDIIKAGPIEGDDVPIKNLSEGIHDIEKSK